MDTESPAPVDLLEEIRAALDGLDPLLRGRIVDIEMARLRVLADPTLFRRVFAEFIKSAVAQSEPPDSITVHVARTGKAARIEVIKEDGLVAQVEQQDLAPVVGQLRALGGDLGTRGSDDGLICWITLPLAPGTSSAADG